MNTNDKGRISSSAPGSQSLLWGDALKQAARSLAAEIHAKAERSQNRVGTFCDHALIDLIRGLEQLDKDLPWEESIMQLDGSLGEQLRLALQRLQLLLSRHSQGRFVHFQQRFDAAPEKLHSDCEISSFDFIMSQGVIDCMQWRGMPLFKSVYDFSIYSMLIWAVGPRTIIELGSGTGASAIWLADLTKIFGISSNVYSVDLNKPELQHENVSFIHGDCLSINTVFDEDFLRSAAHPWILIEDAHVNVYGVLSHFHPYILPGDYVVIEDSSSKLDDINRFLIQEPDRYKVDTY